MKLLWALFALMLAFPLLYLAGAVLRSRAVAIVALLLVAAVCFFLLTPERTS